MTPPVVIRLHRFVPDGGPFGVCGFKSNGKRCQRQPEAQIHRYYPCRVDACQYDKARSIEARDRHEADVHGSGG